MNRYIVLLVCTTTCFFHPGAAQEWELALDKNGITIYTRPTEGSKYKTYKGETTFNLPMDQLYTALIDVENYDKWVYECPESTLLDSKQDKEYTYYSVVSMPWPFDNRDMVTRITVINEGNTIRLKTDLVNDYLPEKEDLVRITAYSEVTTIIKLSDHQTRMIMEGYFEPGGSLPAWLVNMFLSEGPYESLTNLKKLYEQSSTESNP
jgi:hypothetical protein